MLWQDNFVKRNFCFKLFILIVFSLIVAGGCLKADTRSGADTAKKAKPEDTAARLDKFWQKAKKEVDKSVVEILAQDQAELAKGIRHHKFLRGDPAKKEIALTFDDGPHPAYTPKILSVLKKYDVKATFFLVGEMAAQYPELVKAQFAAGHNIGNHTFHHVNLTKIPDEEVAVEIKACGEVLKNITGDAPHLFRPPGGDYDKEVAEVAEALGYTMVLWTDNPGDYESPGSKVIETRILDKISNGGIILIHDGVQQTVDRLPQILEYLMGKGYRFVTIDEMMGDK